MQPKEVVSFAKENKAQFVDFKFIDFPGIWQHFTVPISEFDEASFEEGYGFDGSSIRGWKEIHASDMLILPDPVTAVMDPFSQYPTLSLITNILDPITKESYTRDPRYVAQKAEAYLKSTGIGDTAYFGPEAEFFIFDDIRFEQKPSCGYFYIDSIEARWNSGREENPNLGYKPRHKEGYFPVPPTDSQSDLRSEMVLEMQKVGIHIEAQHHEVATAGQAEIDMRFDNLTKMGDQLMWFKYIVKNVARRHNKTVTFMPKPIFGDNGSGMHVHQSIWKGGKPLFVGDKYGGLSEMALHYIGGILKHAPAICAFTNPTTNSYRRLVPGFEAPVNLAYSSRNRSASIRIPMYSASPKAKRIEVRFPDPSSNGYLAFAVMLMAGLDGVQNRINPGEPLDKDIYALSPEELKNVPSTPGSLEEALKALEKDHEFLLKGDVITEDVVETWIKYKTENEVKPINMRPTPHEFELYYDI
ncbi:MAG: type I glutamate--ammonia ligase [Deltaproteobacteria bacterium RIFCSPLOWO2_02_FULL_50_16]|nr:MAG: type I glutamate--ammonia ligase [Deltaproteobacteria bacterium RIFCSPHIGHO2_02_FULL_50_15]OGQ55723.1 MAG: type I glutamate--ammonia ligase [Deltaproteobacteria bacterium RIFCSPLOWO2_02_FULL_50_16]OGQ65452.1 MAG: type I glutamate--ammonia ligase [Deltaproteobacteria bacterium RIFCSPLOWO2_12_FULL_50_11]